MNSKLSAVIITKNEKTNILRCINSLNIVADEIIVVDSGSSDGTLKLLETTNATVINSDWLGYAKTKNLGNQKASNDFILSLDADEELSKELIDNILKAKLNGLQGTYSFNRLTNYIGVWIKNSGWYPDEKIRLFDKKQVSWKGEFVHETLSIPLGLANTKLSGDLFHYSYSSVTDHKSRADNYSALTAEKLFSEGKSASLFSPFLSPLVRFLKMYIIQKGFLDGKSGFQIAQISAASNRFKYRELNRLHKKKKLQNSLKHVLISRTDSIGDVMLTLPMVKALKSAYPQLKISFLARNYTKPLLECNGLIDEFIVFEKDKEPVLNSIPDAVILVLPDESLSKFFKKKKVTLRIGSARRLFNLLHCNKFVYYSRRKSNLHESQLNLKMLQKLHIKSNFKLDEIPELYEFKPQAELPSEIKALNSNKIQIILHPKSQGSAPEWKLENFNSLAQMLKNRGFQVFFSGTENEGKLFRDSINFDQDIVDVSGKMSLAEFISFIHQCDGLVASSTGPLHIAAALDKTAVGLYSNERPMFPARWGPIGIKASVIERKPVLNFLDISVEDVFQKIENQFKH